MTFAPWLNVIKRFSNVCNKLECFQLSLMFVYKARSLPKNVAIVRCFTLVDSSLTHNIGLGWKDLPGRDSVAYYKYP
jgi:hypothetical protein